ncbi:hypothetical protein GGF32_005340 [Allomyces javanicus]|nr:hypothetical protein GGF32_005340 [Allomyces javanicus]
MDCRRLVVAVFLTGLVAWASIAVADEVRSCFKSPSCTVVKWSRASEDLLHVTLSVTGSTYEYFVPRVVPGDPPRTFMDVYGTDRPFECTITKAVFRTRINKCEIRQSSLCLLVAAVMIPILLAASRILVAVSKTKSGRVSPVVTTA